jgi:hypothetical protein
VKEGMALPAAVRCTARLGATVFRSMTAETRFACRASWPTAETEIGTS